MKLRVAILAAPLVLGACSSAMAVPAGGPSTAAVPDTAPALVPAPISSGTFRGWSEGATAVTYDTAAVPAGATAEVAVTDSGNGVRVRVTAGGLVPGRAYGAHLHANPCTADPAEAGPHYQHRVDPAARPGKPSVDPAYANPKNEIWLDFVAGADGSGTTTSVQSWRLDPQRPPWSLVLHAQHTNTEHGEAGTAGARLACLTRDPIPAYASSPGRG
ncbi:superoxide dismutase family protein [Actinoplanes sp. DH11]|uniref:superoxide dismutase family protein n=1 Tax=Actinoplanes sp. DH11 TaxID=2857011 RepID=UPI001E350B29|nr:superoxide dismutase family protein [Actinoplanes sp. DH11]